MFQVGSHSISSAGNEDIKSDDTTEAPPANTVQNRGSNAQHKRSAQHGHSADVQHTIGSQTRSSGSDAKAPHVSTDTLAPSKPLQEMTDDEILELAHDIWDGTGRVDLVMDFFGLTRCKSTIVGSAMVRGISGGERKRLSTVEMLMGAQQVLMLDEISTGLVRYLAGAHAVFS